MTRETVSTTYQFSNCEVQSIFNISITDVASYIDIDSVIFVTDENVYKKYAHRFPMDQTIIIPGGEEHKNIETVMKAIGELHQLGAGRERFVVGVGGGVVTDVTGFLASIYLRGLRFAFVPTTILAMVDAAVGGKNGVNDGMIKNQIGVIRQPEFLFYDYSFLKTLPQIEWVSGFAEIIKHACIKDADMFQYLLNNSIEDFRGDIAATGELIRRNAGIKFGVVCGDETESGERRLLNFGHTIGHAIENILKYPHGFAVSIGMVYACRISEKLAGFPAEKTEVVIHLLKKYHLPVEAEFDKQAAWNLLIHDKKKSGDHLHFILLKDIGQGISQKIALNDLKKIFFEL